MSELQMGAVESRFADIIWSGEPISTGELAKKSEAMLGWKKTTSYTVLKRLCNKGIFRTENGTVTSVMSRDEFYSRRSVQFIEDTFDGSLPAFLAAFTAKKPLSNEEIAELRHIIDNYSEV